MISLSSPPLAKLHDFGSAKKLLTLRNFAKTMSSGPSLANLGQSGVTLGYAAPELLEGDANFEATPACDIYSLGATMYSMLSGKTNFVSVSRDNVEQLDENVVSEELITLICDMIAFGKKINKRPNIDALIDRVTRIAEKFPLDEDEGDELYRQCRKISRTLEKQRPSSPRANNNSSGSTRSFPSTVAGGGASGGGASAHSNELPKSPTVPTTADTNNNDGVGGVESTPRSSSPSGNEAAPPKWLATMFERHQKEIPDSASIESLISNGITSAADFLALSESELKDEIKISLGPRKRILAVIAAEKK
jgi:serine/threonine protein kinase